MATKSDGTYVSVNDSLSYYPSKVLGHGNNAVVFEGEFGQMKVAVKQIDCRTSNRAREIKKEAELFRKIEKHRHKNIVGFYQSLAVGKYNYVVLEYCQGTLASFIEDEALRSSYPRHKIMKAMTRGLAYLHSINIAHRDLKPENIFYRTKGGSRAIQKFVLADFGISRSTMHGMFTQTDHKGSLGYFPHEVCIELEGKKPADFNKQMFGISTDIFALGCLFYYIATNGNHPFGKNALEMYSRIKERLPPDLHQLQEQNQPLECLLQTMLSHTDTDRPTAHEVLQHPALWSYEKVKKYLFEMNGYVGKCLDEGKFQENILEDQSIIPDGGWINRLPPVFREHIKDFEMNKMFVYRDNDFSVRVLLRAIRNVEAHFHELDANIIPEIGETPNDRMSVWNNACPKLLMHLYRHFGDNVTHEREAEEEYMETEDDAEELESDNNQDPVESLIYINHAANGSLEDIKRYRNQGFDMNYSDYDGRTALHLAAAEGHVDIVKYLLHECNVDRDFQDRWGHTARDEAERNKHDKVKQLFDGPLDGSKEDITAATSTL